MHPAADLGERAHRTGPRHLGNVDGAVSVEHGDVDGFVELCHQLLQVRQCPGGQQALRAFAEPDQSGTQCVSARRLLAHVSLGHERPQQPVDGRHGQPGLVGELADRHLATTRSEHLEQVERPLDGLHTAAASSLAGVASTILPHSGNRTASEQLPESRRPSIDFRISESSIRHTESLPSPRGDCGRPEGDRRSRRSR